MPASFRISSLKIDAFRGVTGSIDLDLRSPLTLICAANGTGKTTLCDAAEWLLTGVVERLREGQHFDESVLVSKFSAADPKVTAHIRIGDDTWLVERTLGSVRIGRSSSNMSDILLSELLERLAPVAASTGVHALTAIALRQRWLRGTRFLSSEAMAALIDTDEETLSRRKQVFADMLGIRHLLDAEDRLRRYVDAVSQAERALGRQADEARENLDSALQSAPNAARSTTAAVDELLRAESLLGVGQPAEGLPSRLERLAAEFGRRQLALRQLNTALEIVLDGWSQYAELMRQVERQEEEERACLENINRKTANLRLADNAHRTAAARQEALANEQIPLTELRDITLPSLARLVADMRASRASLDIRTPLRDLTSLLPEATWAASTRRTRREHVRDLIQYINAVPSQRDRIGAIETRLAAIRRTMLSPDALADLSRAVGEAELRVNEARARVDSIVEPLQRLQSEAMALIQHQHSAGCPVCGHDWRTRDSLQQAMKRVMSGAPGLVHELEERLTQATAALQASRHAYSEGFRVRQEARQLERELDEALQSLRDFRERAAIVGVDVDRSDHAPHLAILEERLIIADSAAQLINSLGLRSQVLAQLLPDTTALSDAPTVLSQALEARIAERNGEAADAQHRVTEANAVRTRIRLEIADETRKLESIKSQLAQAKSSRQSVNEAWRRIAAEAPITDGELRAAQDRVASEMRRVEGAEQHLAAAKAALLFETARHAIADAERKMSLVFGRRNRIASRRETAQRAMAVFRSYYAERSRQQVDELSGVVNALFARMQANRIFDRIHLGAGDDFLKWLAGADGQMFDPTTEFSQGQRQDLALSLFLARARSLGGTFFLDEPLLHLDDLNRVGLLDVLRAIAIEGSESLNLVVTTASRAVARHLAEKFARVSQLTSESGLSPALRIVELRGNARAGIEKVDVVPMTATRA